MTDQLCQEQIDDAKAQLSAAVENVVRARQATIIGRGASGIAFAAIAARLLHLRYGPLLWGEIAIVFAAIAAATLLARNALRQPYRIGSKASRNAMRLASPR